MRMLVAAIAGGVYGFLSALHVYWALGGRWGGVAVVPEVDGKPAFTPGPGASWLVAGALAVAAWLVLAQGGLLPGIVPAPLRRIATLVLGALFLLRAAGDFKHVGFFKKVRGTRFARMDDFVYAPLCLLLGLAAMFLAR